MSWIERYERVLRIPPDTPAEYLTRYRAIWLVGMLFVAIQLTNLITMTITYGKWTLDHTVALCAATLVAMVVALLRWYKNYHFFAFTLSALTFLALTASALPNRIGINSALVPLVIVGPLINGYVSGSRAALIFSVFAGFYLTFLYWISVNTAPLMMDGTYVREANRYTNALYYLVISTSLSVMLTQHTFSAMRKMRESAERAEKAEAAQSEFLAKMSHELRTPLNGVIGLTDTLLASPLPDREAELARSVRQSGESLMLILNDLLDLSKIEAGKMTIIPTVVNLKSVIEGAMHGWKEVAKNKGLMLHIVLPDSLDQGCSLDELRVRQIIHNLMSNAMKFTEKGRVSLSVTLEDISGGGQMLVMCVSDTGCGISDTAAERIFESFEQADSIGERIRGGTGLGLPISRMLAELMGGRLVLERSTPKGSTFIATLPFVPASMGSDAPVIKTGRTDFNGRRVLVAEDHEINKLVLTEFLKILNLTYEVAKDGVECLEWLERSEFDVILMDKNMPRMNGLETLIVIRSGGKPYSDIPVIAVTADAMIGERERLISHGMDGFLSKPLNIEELARVLSEVLPAETLSHQS